MNSSNTQTMNSSSRIIKLTTVATVNGRREQHHRSDYRKYLPGQVIRIHLKIEENCHLFLDTFNSVLMNDLTTTLTSRLKMDAKCANQWNWIRAATYFGTSPADWVHGCLCFEPGAEIWTKRFRRVSATCDKIIRTFFFKFIQDTCPWLTFAWIFIRGSVGQIIYRKYIVFSVLKYFL